MVPSDVPITIWLGFFNCNWIKHVIDARGSMIVTHVFVFGESRLRVVPPSFL